MKKYCYLLLITAALLTGCSSEQGVTANTQDPSIEKQTETSVSTTSEAVSTETTASTAATAAPITFATIRTTTKPIATTTSTIAATTVAEQTVSGTEQATKTETQAAASEETTAAAETATTAATTKQTMLTVRTSFTTMTVTSLMRQQTTYLFTEPEEEPEEPEPDPEPEESWESTYVYDEYYRDYDLSDYKDTFDNTLFIGDSIIYGLRRVESLSKDHIAGLVGLGVRDAMDTQIYVDGNEVDVFTAAKKTTAKNIVCSFGLNDINQISEKKFVAAYRKLLDTLHDAAPKAHLSVLSITPVLHENTKYSNSKIDRYNQALKAMCKDYGCQYIDITPELKNCLNGLKTDYHRGDGIHLSLDGYQAFLWQIGKALK